MSSIKQVQDLQTQIAELTQENSDLRTSRPSSAASRRAASLQARPKRIPAPPMKDFDEARRNIQVFSKDIFETPSREPLDPSLEHYPQNFPELPSRSDFAYISRCYLDSIHEAYPILHWPTFQEEVDTAFKERDLQGRPREWVGLFFAVLCCGHLNLPANTTNPARASDNGRRFYEIATQSISPWQQEPSIIHAQTLFLLSLYATESNMRFPGSMWLASAIRVAQCLGLGVEDDAQHFLWAEMRRRLWWALYVRDRITSFGANCPMLISEDDCDISLPNSVEDRYMKPEKLFRPVNKDTYSTGFLAIITISRLYSGLYQTLKSSIITPENLAAHDDDMRAKFALLPPHYSPASDAYLEPSALGPLFAIHFARFQLYRRNLSPVCAPMVRTTAFNSCASIAQDTAKCIQRVLQTSSHPESSSSLPSDKTWQTRVINLASNMMCLHLWRCILILCLRRDFSSALLCTHLLVAIGGVRSINTACGRNASFFLEVLLERLRSPIPNAINRPGVDGGGDKDQELLAYASGDAQSLLEHSWVWQASHLASSTSPSPISPAQSSALNSFASSSAYSNPNTLSSNQSTMSETASNHPLPIRNPHRTSTSPAPPAYPHANDADTIWPRVQHLLHTTVEECKRRGILVVPPSPTTSSTFLPAPVPPSSSSASSYGSTTPTPTLVANVFPSGGSGTTYYHPPHNPGKRVQVEAPQPAGVGVSRIGGGGGGGMMEGITSTGAGSGMEREREREGGVSTSEQARAKGDRASRISIANII
ncbi:hypothetical protein DM02DRAFT_72411 [Periconia macrospinosa]|uniref:Xylanolytic transcriptional activator regulatory domain-containing protein n=1 Tax=Periconia macrospinosa TaxID=97972 RepID=A0A2V1DKF2_9PLEO|nr:hypothetical protein DM02DRAFT_72411 [Periconia macrospinosa]